MRRWVQISSIGLLAVGLCVVSGCGESPKGSADKESPKAAPDQTRVANAAPPQVSGKKATPTPAPTLTPEPERRVTLTTTTTLRELAVELTRQLGVEYAADDDVAETTITLDVKNATAAEVETLVRERAGVSCVYSDRDIEPRWVHFASPR
ncbi:MAG: hypothetical protein D6691_04575 [Candidatus Hydrogenedentota bacterium]|uniref:Secretin/TonB short N-terminal domain-containing protein n=1 Tax=Sumerlaea chitinivorans TaxID=2250252 RepID=A0A2Z4Y840_SUMC1|nr:hypothetical protein BRCON_2045 [Candidatus Sumerlaea chitinivorans]MCX7963816.1 hypothetical protein [Candidatus Sumerlaea chitinivorans]RMH28617.1 MAG: hypothetical protein D6691_04575 [Candidatus Hydrogenedentota bacterium]